MRQFRRLVLIAAVLLVARPAQASSIQVLVGDKDWFGAPGQTGGAVPWTGHPGPLYDARSTIEALATNGAQLTDVYSALYYSYPCDPANDSGCSPNKDTGSVLFPFSGILQSATLTVRMGDFESTTWGPMAVDINGVSLPFGFEDGFRVAVTRNFTLTPEMVAAANLAGEVRLNFDHRGAYGTATTDGYGSMDYIAFDYFEMNAEVVPVPEPATFVLIGLGLAGLAGRRIRRLPFGRLRAHNVTQIDRPTDIVAGS